VPYVAARFVPVPESQLDRGPIRGWCPGVLDPMETGDGWLLRVRLPGGALNADDLRLVAGVASELGSGFVEITSRANLQIRGVAADEIGRAATRLVAAGLAEADAGADARRAVVASPLAGHDSAASCDATPVVAAIVSRLVADLAGSLPAKFGVVVDDGGSWPLGGVDGDVRLHASPTGWTVRVRGNPTAVGVTSDPAHAVLHVAQQCIARGARLDRGTDAELTELDSGRPRTLGLVRHRDEGRRNVVAAPFLGRLDAATLIEMADLAERFRADVRLTPDHSIVFCGVAADDAPGALTALSDLGLVVDPEDGRAMVSACVGSRGCASALADTSAAAHLLAARTPVGRTHLSACTKRCGAPSHAAGITHLVADATGEFR